MNTSGKTGFKADKDSKGIVNLLFVNGGELTLEGNNGAELGVYKSNQRIHKIINLEDDIHHLDVTLKNGGRYRQKMYIGSSYLSQEYATFVSTEQMSSIAAQDGTKQRIDFQ